MPKITSKELVSHSQFAFASTGSSRNKTASLKFVESRRAARTNYKRGNANREPHLRNVEILLVRSAEL